MLLLTLLQDFSRIIQALTDLTLSFLLRKAPDLQNLRKGQYHRKKIQMPGTGLGSPATPGRFLPSSLQRNARSEENQESVESSVPTLLTACVRGAHEASPSQCNAPQERVCCLGGPCSGTWKGSCLLSRGPRALAGARCFGTTGATQRKQNTVGRTRCQRCRQAARREARAATLSVQG